MARKKKWVNSNPDGSGWYARNHHIYEIPPWVPETPKLPENPLDAVPELKALAIFVWENIAMVFGSCLELMSRQYMSAKQHLDLTDTLRHLELLVRRIVMIAALAYADLKPVQPNKGPWGVPRLRRELWYDPTSWRVSFSVLRGPRQRGPKRKTDKRPSPTRPTDAVARRIEAIRRVLSYIPGYAQRFARRMQRLRAHNAKANQPRRITLAQWDFHPHRRTQGKWAVNTGMVLAQPLGELAIDILLEPG